MLALAVTACGGGASSSSSSRGGAKSASASSRTAKPTLVKLAYRPLYRLSAAVQDPASAALGGDRFVLLGGLDAADTSTANVVVADPHGPRASASLPGAQHDAQAAALGGNVYVFGGGNFSQYDHILRYDPSVNSVSSVGTLPSAASDVAVTGTDGTAYVVGGFDGTNWLNTIVAYRPGSGARVVGHLPVALRYAAVSPTADGQVLIVGGSTPSGASDAIYRFGPASGGVRQIGRLAHPITHAGAALLGASVYLVGGRGDSLDSPTGSVLAINPATGTAHHAGHLPQPLSDAGVLALGGAIIVAGGRSPAGTQAAVGELLPTG